MSEKRKFKSFATMTPEREAKITELIGLIHTAFPPAGPPFLLRVKGLNPTKDDAPTLHNNERLFAYAFLQSREWNVEKALEMVKTSTEYRIANQLDTRASMPPAMALRGFDVADIQKFLGRGARETGRLDRVCAGVDAYFSNGFHYWDKEGHPVLYLMIGRVDEANLLKRLKQMANIGQTPTDVVWEFVQHMVEVGEAVSLYQQHLGTEGKLKADVTQGFVRSVTIIIDLKGLTYDMLWKPALDLFTGALSRLFRNYADCVNRILLVNSPGIVLFAYNIVKGALTPTVQRKVSIHNEKDTLEALKEVLDEEYIPSFYGGACTCEGNCIGSFNPSEPRAHGEPSGTGEGSDNVETQYLKLTAGKSHEVTFEMKKGEQVHWEFTSTSGSTVGFKTYFVPSGAVDAKSLEKVSTSKLAPFVHTDNSPTEGADSFTASEDGTLILSWDNTKSWFTSKQIQMRVFKQSDGTGSNS